MSFEQFECDNCGDEFRASADANAADGPYCSPTCEAAGEDLADYSFGE